MFGKNFKKSNIVGAAKSIIYNKYVLYVVFLAALFDLLYSAVKEDYTYCILFVLIGFLMAFFNKNMTVILTLTIAVSTILRNLIRGIGLNVEGLTPGPTTKPTDPTKNKEQMKPKSDTNADDASDSTEKESLETVPKTTTPAPTKSELMGVLRDQALDLQEAQQNIIQGFEKIEPYMNKAESLIGSIQETATTIQGMRTQQGFKGGSK